MENKIKWSAKIRTPENYEGANISVFTGLRPKSERDGGTMWQTAKLVAGSGVKATGKVDIESSQFKKVLDACKYRTAFWLLEIYTNKNNGRTSNTVSEYMIDPDQEDVSVDSDDEGLPSFLKEGGREPGSDDGEGNDTVKQAEKIFKGKAVKKPRA